MENNQYDSKESLFKSVPEIQNNQKIKEGEKVIDLLIEIPLIKELSFNVIKQISHEFTKKNYKKNEYVIMQGDPINDIYLILKGSFIITLNHYIEYNVEPDINTFIQYQNITMEPFNTDRNYEIKGKIKKKEEIELFIYQRKFFFGDIEISSNKQNSLFNIKANEDNSIICTMERKKWCGIIYKIREKFNKITSNKIDIIQERIKEILLKKKKLKFDKLKLNKNKIYYQLVVNNNYNICNQLLNNLINNDLNNHKTIKNSRKKYYIKKNISFSKNEKNMKKSKSLLDIKSCQKKVMNLFKFPIILKSETRKNVTQFFNNFYVKRDKKKVKLTETKIDSEPIYINRFRGFYNMTPQQKSEFLNIVKKYLDNNYKKGEYQNPKKRQKKSNIEELYNIYNYYNNNSHEITCSTNFSKNNIMYRTSSMLNSSLKSNLKRNNIRKNSLFQTLKSKLINQNQNYSSLNLETYKNIQLGNIKTNLYYGEKNQIKKKKIQFNKLIMNYTNKNKEFGNNLEKNENLGNKFNYNKKNIIKPEEYYELNKKRFSVITPLNNKIFKNEKITTKSIFEVLLKNKCQTVKSQILENIGGEKINNMLDFKIKINNNIDIRNEDYVKSLFLGNKFKRTNSFKKNDNKFN